MRLRIVNASPGILSAGHRPEECGLESSREPSQRAHEDYSESDEAEDPDSDSISGSSSFSTSIQERRLALGKSFPRAARVKGRERRFPFVAVVSRRWVHLGRLSTGGLGSGSAAGAGTGTGTSFTGLKLRQAVGAPVAPRRPLSATCRSAAAGMKAALVKRGGGSTAGAAAPGGVGLEFDAWAVLSPSGIRSLPESKRRSSSEELSGCFPDDSPTSPGFTVETT
ncbi:hypothetical protein EYF80_049675 [Liparis tanakae]|uniref:Uncharacterized protein n=1 Tax=Liparis tanakae TaxID=230148 RepID=A0A4Z2FG14_9TELE|nr:hypothetical protein EYF80_049675 [Liparis tanakae]